MYYETLFIPTRTGRYAKYAHSGKEMKVDGFCRALNLIVEGQGDVGFYDFVSVGGEVRWNLDGSPYHVTDDVEIPAGVSFYIDPGVSVYVSE